MYLFDSDTLRAFGDGHPALFARLQQVRRSEVAIPSVVLGEVLRGRIEYALKADTVDQLIVAHRLLLQTWDMLKSFHIVSFDEASGREFTQLTARFHRHKRRADMLIASVARAEGAHCRHTQRSGFRRPASRMAVHQLARLMSPQSRNHLQACNDNYGFRCMRTPC